MKRIVLALLACILLGSPAYATERKPLVGVSGTIKSLPSGDTLKTNASASGGASINIPHGTAPTSPNNGDCWTTTAGLYCRINGATVGPYVTSGGGGGSGDVGLISEVVTSSSQATVTFSSIPATYRDLEIRVRGRGTTLSTSTSINMTFNNDTGANYDYRSTQNAGSFAALAANFMYVGNLVGAGGPSNAADYITIEIGDYRGTTFQKAGVAMATVKQANSSASLFHDSLSFWWRSTSAINRVDLACASGAFVDGTVVSLYGRK